jgi:adenosylcobinamide-phosphate synthase
MVMRRSWVFVVGRVTVSEFRTMARLAGFEPATRCLEGSCSVQLSYRRPESIVHERSAAFTSSWRNEPGGGLRRRPALREARGRAAPGTGSCLSSYPVTRSTGQPRPPAAGRDRLAGRRWPAAGGIIAGAAADAILGDPRRGHPVALFGRAAQAAQDRLYADSRLRGLAYAVGCVLPVILSAAVAERLARRWPLARLALTAITAWAVTGAASLAAEAGRIRTALSAGNLAAARAALPSLCGRDPGGLDEAELARAVIESVAENTSDGAVAPLLWGGVAGLPGLAAYRAVNTLDSMVGYRSRRYGRFGWASARLDDVASWGPARLTGLLAVACAPAAGGSPAAAWRALREYGGCHPSPNAGRCEAAFAGALGVRLGGSNDYAGMTERRPWLGDGRAPGPADIGRAIRLSRAITAAAAGIAALAAMITEDRAPARPAGRDQGRAGHGRPSLSAAASAGDESQ